MAITKVGIAGLGTVGAEVARWVLARPEQFKLSAVAVRDTGKDRGLDLASVRLCATPQDLVADDVDVVVELMGGAEGDAKDLVLGALNAGKKVVTANKALLAAHWDLIMGLKKPIFFEASVAGGIPVIATLCQSLRANQMHRISGIMNGTCNFILTKMGREGASYAQALQEAQALGYAEADPAFDVDGDDTAQKLYILARLAGAHIAYSDLDVHGISKLPAERVVEAFKNGGAMRLIAMADLETGEYRVAPQRVPAGHPLAEVDGVLNAVVFEGDMLPALAMIGPGAGGKATASAVCADLLLAAG